MTSFDSQLNLAFFQIFDNFLTHDSIRQPLERDWFDSGSLSKFDIGVVTVAEGFFTHEKVLVNKLIFEVVLAGIFTHRVKTYLLLLVRCCARGWVNFWRHWTVSLPQTASRTWRSILTSKQTLEIHNFGQICKVHKGKIERCRPYFSLSKLSVRVLEVKWDSAEENLVPKEILFFWISQQ